jgi:uncharacterized membrane protein YdjX (TVP38/TMEM64 family)
MPSTPDKSPSRPPTSAHAPRRKNAIGDLLFRPGRSRRAIAWATGILLVIAGLIAGIFVFSDLEVAEVMHKIDWSGFTERVGRLNPILMLAAMAILPVFGFPVSVVYLLAGVRFGPLWGGVVVASVTAVHLLASYGIARSVFRRPLQRFIEKRHKRLPRIPDDEQAMVALIVALVPGPPYLVRIYLLALADMKLRIYFWVALLVFTVRSYVTILLGDLSSDPSGRRLVILVIVDAAKIVICAAVIWWLRVHHRRHHPNEHVLEPANDATPS